MCCIDRLKWQHKADIHPCKKISAFTFARAFANKVTYSGFTYHNPIG
jgi:hypothetical protein